MFKKETFIELISSSYCDFNLFFSKLYPTDLLKHFKTVSIFKQVSHISSSVSHISPIVNRKYKFVWLPTLCYCYKHFKNFF